MNPPSLREICAKAMESRPTLSGYLSTWTPTRTFTRDESALAARFSPATALAVYEALEVIQKSCGELRYSQRKKFSDDHFSIVVCDRVLANCKSMLALLDGRTEP